jgi:hypothetical protein
VADYLAGPDKPWELGGRDSPEEVGAKVIARLKT